MGISGIHHLAMKCKGLEEFEETVAFYRDVLGLRIARTWGEGEGSAVMLDTGAGLLEIFANGEDAPHIGAVRHFAFRVDDTTGAIAAVRAAGYPITKEPTDIVIPSEPPYPARIAFCLGPIGEEIEFFEER